MLDGHLRDGEAVDLPVVAAVVAAAASSGVERYEQFVERFREADTPQDQLRYLYALADFDDEALMSRTLDPPRTRGANAERPYVLARCILNRDAATRPGDSSASTGSTPTPRPNASIVRMVDPVKTLTRPEQQADVAAFFAEHDIPQAAKTLQQVLERQRVNVSLRERGPDADRPLRSVRSIADPRVEVFAVEPSAAQLVVRASTTGPRAVRRYADRAGQRARRRVGAAVVDRLDPTPRTPSRSTVVRPRRCARCLLLPGGSCRSPPCPTSTSAKPASGGAAPVGRCSQRPSGRVPAAAERAGLRAPRRRREGDLTHDSRAASTTSPPSCWPRVGSRCGSSPATTTAGTIATTTEPSTWPATRSCSTSRRPPPSWPGSGAGEHRPSRPRARVRSLDDALRAAARRRPTPLVLHHQLMTTPFPYYLPPGVYGPAANRLLDRIAATNPATMVTTGHTHRHRRRRHGPVMITEVGSTKDHPGTWGGYLAYEGGIVQTVRRIMDPEALAWTERTRRSALGAWGAGHPGASPTAASPTSGLRTLGHPVASSGRPC